MQQGLRSLVPSFVRRPLKYGLKAVERRLASRTGLLANFIIIGAQKCGTTSLYEYLVKHPSIYGATTKEVGYFDRYYDNGIGWYRSHFPTSFRRRFDALCHMRNVVTGEASTGYILYPHALRRIAHTIPGAKLILMLRNPVERAYSHYQHSVRIGKETLPFEEAIEREHERVGPALERIKRDASYYSEDIDYYAYVATGIYIDQVKVLMELFPPEQVLILKAEEFYDNAQHIFDKVLNFLGMPPLELAATEKHNAGTYGDMDEAVRRRLAELFAPYNRRLYEFLGADVFEPWEDEAFDGRRYAGTASQTSARTAS